MERKPTTESTWTPAQWKGWYASVASRVSVEQEAKRGSSANVEANTPVQSDAQEPQQTTPAANTANSGDSANTAGTSMASPEEQHVIAYLNNGINGAWLNTAEGVLAGNVFDDDGAIRFGEETGQIVASLRNGPQGMQLLDRHGQVLGVYRFAPRGPAFYGSSQQLQASRALDFAYVSDDREQAGQKTGELGQSTGTSSEFSIVGGSPGHNNDTSSLSGATAISPDVNADCEPPDDNNDADSLSGVNAISPDASADCNPPDHNNDVDSLSEVNAISSDVNADCEAPDDDNDTDSLSGVNADSSDVGAEGGPPNQSNEPGSSSRRGAIAETRLGGMRFAPGTAEFEFVYDHYDLATSRRDRQSFDQWIGQQCSDYGTAQQSHGGDAAEPRSPDESGEYPDLNLSLNGISQGPYFYSG